MARRARAFAASLLVAALAVPTVAVGTTYATDGDTVEEATATTADSDLGGLVSTESPWTVVEDDGAMSTVEGESHSFEDTAPEPMSPLPPETLSAGPQNEELELLGEVDVDYVGPSDDGTEVYQLEATVAVPETEGGVPLKVPEVSFVRSESAVPLAEVADATIDGAEVAQDDVETFHFPREKDDVELADVIPDDVTGDLVTFDTEDVDLVTGTTFSAEIHLPELEAQPAEWTLYSGQASARSLNVTTRALRGEVPSDHVRLVVQVGGDRLLSGDNGVERGNDRLDSVYRFSPEPGAELQLYRPLNAKQFGNTEANNTNRLNDRPIPVKQPWATCTSDSNGECVFDVPVSGPDTHAYYWVGMTKASPGFEIQEAVRTGGSGAKRTDEGQILRYAYATPNIDRSGGKTYYSGKHEKRGNNDGWGSDWHAATEDSAAFMHEAQSRRNSWLLGPVGTRWDRSALGIFQQRRSNPPLPNRCGLRVGLIVDTSGSMGKTGINAIKQILAGGSGKTGFIDEVGKTQTELGFVRFDDDSPAENNIVSPLSMNSDIDREKSKKWVGKLNSDNGGTNWEAGLRQFAEYNNANPALKYDVVFMITDGNPTKLDTKTKDDNGIDGEFRHVEAAMGMANTLKAQGTRVVPVGIPANWPRRASGTGETQLSVSDHNLQALSGMNSDGSSTSLRRSDFATFTDADVFRQALINTLNDCAITVERRFYEGDDPNAIPSRDNTRPTIEESRQWGFDGVLTPAGGQRTEQTKEYPTAEPDSDNLVARIGLNGTTNYSSIAVREETGKIPETWERMPAEGGQHAQCFRRNGDPVSVTNLDSRDQANPTNDFQLNNVPLAGGIHCVVYYRAKTIPTTYDLRLRKVDATDTTVSLDGAEFELRSLNDEGQPGDVLPTKSGDNTGEFVWDDLPLGSYVLTETRAAAGGYSLLPQPVYFKVEYDSDELAFFLLEGPNDRTGQRLDGASPSLNFPIVDFMVADQQVDLAIANVRAGELPKTGGAGVGLWIAAGILLIAAGAIGARRRAIA